MIVMYIENDISNLTGLDMNNNNNVLSILLK